MEYTYIELKNEQWRDIEGYDGMYQVSDLGRVRSRKSGEWKVMKPKTNSRGYLQVSLYKGKKEKLFLVHRLVAQAFIENEDETKIYINHRDECKQNNKVSNLEYCTAQYNANYNDVQFRKKNSVRRKIEKLYDHNITYEQNIEVFRANGIYCSRETVRQLRRDLNLEHHPKYKRDIVKSLYRPELTIDENLELFKANGIECCECTVRRLRKDLGLTRKYTKRCLNRL